MDSRFSPTYKAIEHDSDDSLCHVNSFLNDRYRILKLLGQGGFGKTLLAVDERQDSPSFCVIKQLLVQGNPIHHPKALELFHQEARRLTELGKHPQIPKLLDTFDQDGQAFIVQEWIDGWTLEKELIEGEFSEAEIRELLEELLPVVQYLHERQIIHRDIKPDNIIRRRAIPGKGAKRGNLVLVDFGAAKHLSAISTVNTGTMIGSAEYAAPEQIRGQADFTSDLYSLGITCLHLLTKMSPFNLYDMGEDAWKWQEYLTQPVSPALKAILCKLLQPATRRRYQSAAEVLADLNASSMLANGSLAHLEGAAQNAAQAVSSDYSEDKLQPALKSVINAVQAACSTASATIYDPQTQAWYCLPNEMKACRNSRNYTSPTEKLPTYFSRLFNTETKDAFELVFTGMFLFMLTCVGSMTLICVLFEMERRSSPMQPRIQSSLPLSPTIPVK